MSGDRVTVNRRVDYGKKRLIHPTPFCDTLLIRGIEPILNTLYFSMKIGMSYPNFHGQLICLLTGHFTFTYFTYAKVR